jgi:GTP-binding protein
VLNKIDALDDEERAFLRDEIAAVAKGPVLMMSGVSREGIPDVLRALRAEIDDNRLRHRTAAEEAQEAEAWRP